MQVLQFIFSRLYLDGQTIFLTKFPPGGSRRRFQKRRGRARALFGHPGQPPRPCWSFHLYKENKKIRS